MSEFNEHLGIKNNKQATASNMASIVDWRVWSYISAVCGRLTYVLWT